MTPIPSLLQHEVPQQRTLNTAKRTGLRHLSPHHLVVTNRSLLRYLLKVADHHFLSPLPSPPQIKGTQVMPFFLDDERCRSKELKASSAVCQVPGKSNTAQVTIGQRTTLCVEAEFESDSNVKQKLADVNFTSWQRRPPGPWQLFPHASSKTDGIFLQVTHRNQVWLLHASDARARYVIRRLVRV